MTSPTKDQQMIDLYTRDGLSMDKVADKLGCSTGWVSRRLAQLGVKARGNAEAKRNTERDKQIAQDYIDGATAKAIGDQHGISHSRVLEILAAHGVPRRLSASAKSKAEAATKPQGVNPRSIAPQGPQITPEGVKVTVWQPRQDPRSLRQPEPFFSRGGVLPPSPWVQAITGRRP